MNEQPTKEWWLQNDPVKEGWGPFESEAAAWRYLFGRDPNAEDIRQHEEAGWYVGFINRWPNVEVQGREAALAPRSVPLERPVGGESQSPQHGEKG